MKNIILIDKPSGITSFDVIRKLRKKLGIKKVGHAGTLDPLATGLLVLGIGEGTKELKDLIGLDKEYTFEVILGLKTDTGDLEGKILEEKKVNGVDNIEEVFKSLIGEIELEVPKYSAIKVGGEKLYEKARKGEEFEAPKRKMRILNLELIGSYKEEDKYILKAKALVGSGTYIRSLAEEIGRRLGYPSVVRNLRRTKVGSFKVEDASDIID